MRCTHAGLRLRSARMKKGTVYLVGAGPGDAGLLTVRGAELLGCAEVVVYDALVNPDLLRLAPKSAEIIYGGKRAKDHAIPQDELNALLVAKARDGKTVVRLKGGDPYVFGRGGEEAEELAAAKIPFEVVPGVSSIVAGPNYAGIPLTHRDVTSSFAVVTGHEDPSKEASNIPWDALSKIGTVVFLMGVRNIGKNMRKLMEHGKPSRTPVAVITWGTYPAQVLVNLLLRLDRPGEALAIARQFLASADPQQLSCPTIPELCQRAGDYQALAEVAREQGDAVHFLAGLLAGGSPKAAGLPKAL